jgi:hypothetical protein
MRRRKSGPSSDAIKMTAQQEPSNMATPDQDLSVMSVSNINRYFDIDDPSNGPSTIMRRVMPHAAFMFGFSNSTDIGTQDPNAATNVGTADPKDILYPMTAMAKAFETDVYPIVSNLLESGTGSRTKVSFSEMVRYFAMTHLAYCQMRDIITLNTLAYHFDWKSVFPHTDAVPQHIYELAVLYDASDVGMASRWLPLYRRLETKVMFPRFMDDIKRMLTPMLTPGNSGRLMIPTYIDLQNDDAASITTSVENLLSYLEVELHAANATLNSFLPFPISLGDPWSVTQSGDFDIFREGGWWNSGVQNISVFGDTGDPHPTNAVVTNTNPSTEITMVPGIWHSRLPQPTWGEVKMGSIFDLQSQTLDDTFALITPHLYRAVTLYDDVGGYVMYDGVPYSDSGASSRYQNFATCRFVNSTPIVDGVMRDSVVGAELNYQALKRLMRTETRYIFNVELLTTISGEMAGASLRELRKTIKDATAIAVGSAY